MHRTTITLETVLERKLRGLAARERKSFKELVNDLLKRGLKNYQVTKSKKPSFHWNTSDAEPHPAFDPADRSTYLDIISKGIR